MGFAGPGTTYLHFPAAPLIYLSLPASGRGSCLSENWWEGRELGKIQSSCSQEGHIECLSLFILEELKEGKKPAAPVDGTHLLPGVQAWSDQF